MEVGREREGISIIWKMRIWICSCNYCPTRRVWLWWAICTAWKPFLDHIGAPAGRPVYAKVRMLGYIPECRPVAT